VSERWRTEHLLARRPRPADQPAYLDLLLDPEVKKWLRPPPAPPFTEAELAQMVEDDIAHWERHGFGPWVLIEVESGATIGRGGLRWTAVEGELAVELPWAIASRHWRRGFATEAGTAALSWSRALGFEQVIALIRADNSASRRVAEKVGLRHSGEAVHAGLPHLLYRSSP
jgi:RimJ/RimL family protein N-acetyltransferase